MRACLLFLLLILVLAACRSQENARIEPTNTPSRFTLVEAVYNSPAQGALDVTLSHVRVLAEQDAPDTQVFAVLTADGAPPAYVLLPSNQPGLQANNVSLEQYPLRLENAPTSARLWVLALEHSAYPVSEVIGQGTVAETLAEAFQTQTQATTTAQLVAAVGEDLLPWFGEIEVLGEAFITLDEDTTGENRLEAGGLEVLYTVRQQTEVAAQTETETIVETEAVVEAATEAAVETAVEATLAAPTPEASTDPSEAPTVTATEPPVFDVPIPGYRLVIDENFEEAQSRVPWWIGSDPTYSANIVNRAYQITLTGIDPQRNVGLSWGSIQDYVFDDYIVRAKMRVVQSDIVARLGLWLHYVDDYNFVFFGIETTGRYRVARFQRVYTELSPWQSSPIVHTGNVANIIEVRMEGENYTMSINGQEVVATTDDALEEGRITFFCYSETIPATCLLEEIEVWIPEFAVFPRTTLTPLP
jgi:hypothetical protein